MRARLDRFLEGAAGWLSILVPLALLAGPAAGDITASLVAVLFLFHCALTRDWGWTRERWVQWLLLLWLYISLHSLFQPEIEGAASRCIGWIRFPLFAIALAHWLLPAETTRTRLLASVAAATVWLIADMFWQYFTGVDLAGRPLIMEGDHVRLSGPFTNPRAGITTLFFYFLPLLYFLSRAQDNARRTLLILYAAAGLVAIYLSGERMAFLLTCMGLMLCLLLLRRQGALLLASILIAAIGIHLFNQQRETLAERQIGATHQAVRSFWDTTYGRTWSSAVEVAQAHPLIGVGSKQFATACKARRAADPIEGFTCPVHPHNIYLEWLVDFGLVGLALFLGMVGSWALLLIRRWHAWRYDAVALGLVVTLVLRLWPISVTTGQFIAWAAVPFWLCAGWLLALLLAPRKGT